MAWNEPDTALPTRGTEPGLCYIQHPWAYFTTRPLHEQWGDDWNDAPYEGNAGAPYPYGDHDRKAGTEPWEIVAVAFTSPLVTPADLAGANSQFSVEQINARCVPWLQSYWGRAGEGGDAARRVYPPHSGSGRRRVGEAAAAYRRR